MKKRTAALVCAVLMLVSVLAGCGNRSGEVSREVEEAQRGVVRVAQVVRVDFYSVENGKVKGHTGSADGVVLNFGTAFGVGEAGKPTDIFVTNRHVVSDSSGVSGTDDEGNITEIYTATVTNMYILLDDFAYDSSNGLDKSRAIPCSIEWKAEEVGPDLAVLKAAEVVKERVALPLLDPKDNVRRGDTVYALGFPGSADALTWDPNAGIGRPYASLESMTVTKGSVTLLNHDKESDTDVLQHDIQTNDGNSGSPIVTEYGAVVAVHYSSYTTGGSLETVSKLSVQAGELMDVLDDLKIDYDVYKPFPWWIFAVVAGGLVLAAAVAVIAVTTRKRPRVPAGAAASEPAPAAAPELRIQGQDGAFAGRRFSINGQVRIGRDPAGNDLVFPGDTPGISGQHCVVTLSGNQVTLTDLGSSYGTFLAGGWKLTPHQPVALHIGDRFFLGSDKQSFVITGKGGSLQ